MSGKRGAFPGGWRRALAFSALLATVSAGSVAIGGAAVADETPGDGPTPMIVGGEPADQAYPFMTALMWETNGDPEAFHCGGALIAHDWVVTAAHCVTLPTGMFGDYTKRVPALLHVRVGSNDRTTGGHVAKLDDIRVHPGYRAYEDHAEADDVALLHLSSPVPERPGKLASRTPAPGTKVREIGWGYTSNEDGRTLPTRLRQLDTKTLAPTTEKCQVDKNGDGSWGIRARDVCVDNPEGVRGPCNGDSGSPLLRKVHGRWTIAGVDSRGVADLCGEAPDIYTGTSSHRDWIDGVVS